MRHTLLLSAILLSTALFSQNVGIGTTTPAAKLDINSAHSGLLIPRIALTGSNDITTVPGAAISTLIYSTATVTGANAVSPAFYYWNGTIWVQIGSSSNGGWQLTGNSGTTPGTNFIGTGDNQDLIMKVNNTQAGRLSTAGNTFYGLNAGITSTGTNNVAMGSNALFHNTIGTELVAIGDSALFNVNSSAAIGNVAIGSRSLLGTTSGRTNTAVGFQTLMADNTGSSNTAMGFEALESNTTGASNVAIGSLALPNNTTGVSNIAIGVNSLIGSVSGSNNVSVGQNSLLSSTTGSDNTSVGNSAQFSNITGYSNTAIGTHALFNSNAGSNLVAVGDSALYKQNGGTGGNTAVGSKALFASTTGGNLTALGYHADVATSGLNNATAIGANAVVSSSNAMVLGGTGANAVNVGVGTSSPNASAVLDLTSTSQGFLIPRMTTAQMNAIATPADGLTIYNTDQQCTEMAIGGAWEAIACHCPAIAAIDNVRGPSGVCPGYTASYFVSPSIGASIYTWTVTAGPSAINVPVNNQGSNPVNFTLPSSITSGTYTVSAVVSNACGTSQVTPAPAHGDIFTSSNTMNALGATNITNNAFTANWSLNGVGGANYILLEVATDAAFSNLVYGYPYTLGIVSSFSVTGLAFNTTYYYRVAAGSFSCGVTAYSSGTSVTTVNHGTITYNTPNSTHGGTANVFTVPVGVTSLSVAMAAGNGGNLGPNYQYYQSVYLGNGFGSGYLQGFGDIFTATLAVTPGQVLWISAGANGTDASDNLIGTTAGGYGGVNGDESGGSGAAGTEAYVSTYLSEGGQGAGGGGASDIRTSAGVKLLVAGGGGGAGYNACGSQGWAGGGNAASYGGATPTAGGGTYNTTNIGGGPGTNVSNGSGLTVTASAGPLCATSQASSSGNTAGGNGGTIHTNCSGTCYALGGGGGGGGYHAGGGGDGGGGGGGASYTTGPGVSNVVFTSSFPVGGFGGPETPTNTAGGYVTLTW